MERKIKVALMLTPVEFGGAERVCLTLLKNVNRQRFDLFPILLTRPWEQNNVFVREVREDGYDYREIPVAIRLNEGFWRVIRCYRLVYKLMKEGNFDIVHTNGYFADIIGIPLARLLGIPCLAMCHGFIGNTWKLKYYNTLDRFVLKYCSKIITVSEGVKEQLLKSRLREPEIKVIVNAVDISKNNLLNQKNNLDHSMEEIILGYVGRLSKEKGLTYLLKACSQLVKQGILFKMLIIGDGPQRAELERISQDINLSNIVNFVGFQEDIPSWLFRIDIFILPSLTEGTPMALLEAMACGVPVIATAVGGVPQVIQNGENGILISPGKPEEITNAILAIKNNKQLRKKLVENAFRLIQKDFSIGQWIKKIEAEYIQLCR